ncbi:unnamed protein product [Leptosia nina]|uniref:Alpha-1,6-mannosyl-glycoprotein 2-beta-N-acetylglucosaminyltransferase n=1 Tax=Leptosia nina TaxID=320188 RepID=A0AAV1JE35_9NEOP
MSPIAKNKIKFKKHFISLCRLSGVALGCLCLSRLLQERASTDQDTTLDPYLIQNRNRLDVNSLRAKLVAHNKEPTVLNAELFGDRLRDSYSPVVVIQVQGDSPRLKLLLSSLSRVRDIDTALLIFSFAYQDDSLDRLVGAIRFCRVVQIYFPHSLQLHPHRFPGLEAADYNASGEPCRPRDVRLIEKKQHWWWKANFVFERMAHLVEADSAVVFLEEANYVVPDFIHMLRFLHKSRVYFPHVEMLSFGNPFLKGSSDDLLIVEPWGPPFHLGVSFNATTWKKIRSHSGEYCTYDDYNWNYSLLKLFESFAGGHVDTVACLTPRVISTEEIDEKDLRNRIDRFLTAHTWFPAAVKGVFVFGPKGRIEARAKAPVLGVGGWSDLRDQLLCLDVLAVTTTEEQRYYDPDYVLTSLENNSSAH